MKLLLIPALLLALLVPGVAAPQRASAANRAWRPFFASFREAVKKRDRDAVKKMMSRDFYFLSSGGDENGDQDTRDEAIEFWEETRINGWEALEKTLAAGTVNNTTLREPGNRRPSRVAPPIANSRKARQGAQVDWYAVFEFRQGRWYCISFAQCCD